MSRFVGRFLLFFSLGFIIVMGFGLSSEYDMLYRLGGCVMAFIAMVHLLYAGKVAPRPPQLLRKKKLSGEKSVSLVRLLHH